MAMPFSRARRVQQWLLFHRQWHVVDASNQDVFKLGDRVALHLTGKWKPIYHPMTDCGDNVVVVNCKDVAMKAFGWQRTMYHFDRAYPRSKNDIPAHQIHEYDPCRVLWLTTYRALGRMKSFRHAHIDRLHLFVDEEIPDFIRRNIGNQLEQVQAVPKKSTEYSAEERASFPRLIDYKEDHLLDWNDPQPEIEHSEDYEIKRF